MIDTYRYAIVYFTLFGVLLLLSGLWLFGMKAGLSIEIITDYYLGNDALFTQPKSNEGLLEIAVPHLGATGLFIMVSAHFILFTPQRERRIMVWLIVLWFLSALVNIFAPFAIIAGVNVFVGIKLMAFIVFELLGLYLLWVVFQAAFRGLHHKKN